MPQDLDVLDTSDLDNEVEDTPMDQVSTHDPDLSDEEGQTSDSEDLSAEDGSQSEPQAQTQPQTNVKPETQTEEQFFLKDGDIVYKTKEDAVRSHQYKNQLIHSLRQQVIQQTGIDPITSKPVRQDAAQRYMDNQPQHLQNRPDPVDEWTKTQITTFWRRPKIRLAQTWR